MPARVALDESKLAELWRSGLGGDAIARELHVSRAVMFNRVKGLGLPSRGSGWRSVDDKRPKTTPEEIERMRALLAQGMSVATVARETGRSAKTVTTWALCETLPQTDFGSRRCLKCGKLFRMDYRGNWVCRPCRASSEWQSSSPMEP